MIDGKDIKLISQNGMSVDKMQELEEKLERYIGIMDQPIKGEYGKTLPTFSQDKLLLPRRQRKTDLPQAARFVYGLRPNQHMILHDENLTVRHVTQFDWKDGNTDKLIQLTDELEKEHLIYLKQNRGIISAAKEREMNVLETQHISFDTHQAPHKIEVKGELYLLEQLMEGKSFLSNTDGPGQANVWIYQSLDQQTYIRITENERLLKWHQGTPLLLREILPAEYRTLDRMDEYDQEDFV